MIESQSEKCLVQNESSISVGVHVGSSLTKVKDTHLMNNNQPVAEILCWRLDPPPAELCRELCVDSLDMRNNEEQIVRRATC